MSLLSQFRGANDHPIAHDHCSCHRTEIEKSESCGCFYYMEIFPPLRIREWIDQEQTALCPVCEIDSVIGSASGFAINNEFLERMHTLVLTPQLMEPAQLLRTGTNTVAKES